MSRPHPPSAPLPADRTCPHCLVVWHHSAGEACWCCSRSGVPGTLDGLLRPVLVKPSRWTPQTHTPIGA